MAKWQADLPDVIDPPDDVCFLVQIPNHPDYIAAFHGTYERLSHWWAWRRDPDKQGRLAAARWRESVSATWENITELGDMCALTINVNCGGSGNACCVQNLILITDDAIHLDPSIYDDIVGLPVGTIDDGLNPPSSDWENRSEYEQYKCNFSFEYVDDLLATLENTARIFNGFDGMATGFLTRLLNNTLLSSMIEGLVAAVFTQATYMERLVAAIMGIAELDNTIFSAFGGVVDNLDRNQMVCAIFDAADASEARDNLQALWADSLDTEGITDALIVAGLRSEFEAVFWLYTHLYNVAPAFDLAGIPLGLPGYDCSFCAGVTPTVPEYTIGQDLLHYWELEESTGNRADSHSDWTLVPFGVLSDVPSATGITGDGALFPENSDTGLRIQNVTLVPAFGSDSFTVWLWFNPLLYDFNDNHMLFQFRQTGGGDFVQLWTNWSTQITTATITDAIAVETIALNAVTQSTAGVWHLFAISWDQATQTATYRHNDDDPLTAQNLDLTWNNVAGDFCIGHRAIAGGGEDAYGTMDEVGILPRALTQDEYDFLWNVGQGISYLNLITA